jgi:hypothetical protein
MLPNHPRPTGTLRCIKCGAENLVDAPHCWSCNEHDWREDDESFEPPYPIGFPIVRGVMILLGLLAVALVLLRRSPISSIVVFFIVTPTFLISEFQVLRCRRWGIPIPGRERLLTVFKCLVVLVPLVLFVTLAALLVYPLTAADAYQFFWPVLPRDFTP